MFSFLLRSIVLTLVLSGVAQAKESLPSIAVQKSAKQALLRSMQSQIKKHESMTLNEILADVESQVVHNREYLVRKKVSSETLTKFDDRAAEFLSSVRTAGSPEVVVAVERTQLQQVLSADKIDFDWSKVFFFTSPLWEQTPDNKWLIFLYPIALTVDFMMSPITMFVEFANSFTVDG